MGYGTKLTIGNGVIIPQWVKIPDDLSDVIDDMRGCCISEYGEYISDDRVVFVDEPEVETSHNVVVTDKEINSIPVLTREEIITGIVSNNDLSEEERKALRVFLETTSGLTFDRLVFLYAS